jgi:hypothetical protein
MARLGGALKALGRRFAVACDGGCGAEILKSALMAGMAAAGSAAFDCCGAQPGSLSILLAEGYFDIGVFIRMKGDDAAALFLNAQGLPLKRSEERRLTAAFRSAQTPAVDPEEIRRPQKLEGADDLCASALLARFPIREGFAVFASASCLKEKRGVLDFLGKMGCAVSGEEEAGLFLDWGEDGLEIAGKGERPLKKEALARVLRLAYANVFPGRRVLMPVWAEAWADRLVEAAGGVPARVLSGSGADPDAAESARVFNDEALSLVLTAAFLSGGGRLRELREALPDFCIERKEAYCIAEGKGKVMRLFSAGDSGEAPAEGVRIREKEGTIVIIPHSSRPFCEIYAQGLKSEIAAELCDLYAEKIRSLDKGKASK